MAEGGHGVGGGGAAGGEEAGGGGGGDQDCGDQGEDEWVAGRFVDPAGGEFAEGDGECEADEETGADAGCCGGEDEAEEVGGFCAESHADSEFVGARGDGVGDDAI